MEHQPVSLSEPRGRLRPRAAVFDVPDDESTRFETCLARLGYYYELQAGNAAYGILLA